MQNFEAHPMVSKFRGSGENWPSCASFILCDTGKKRKIMAQTHISAGRKFQMNKKLIDMDSESAAAVTRQCRGCASAVPRQCCGCASACRGFASAVPRQCLGSATVVPRLCHGSASAVPWRSEFFRTFQNFTAVP